MLCLVIFRVFDLLLESVVVIKGENVFLVVNFIVGYGVWLVCFNFVIEVICMFLDMDKSLDKLYFYML